MKRILSSIHKFITTEKTKLAGLSFQQKMEYFWDYYKWYTIIVVALIVSIIYTAVTLSSQKEVILSGYFLDSIHIEEEGPVFASFEDYAQINTATFTTEFFTNLSINEDDPTSSLLVMQRLVASIAAGETDFIAVPIGRFTEFAYQSTPYFADLRKLFTDEQLEQYSDLIIYADKAVQDDLDVSYEMGETIAVEYPDPRIPETMTEPIPVALVLQSEELDMLYKTPDSLICFGFMENTSHFDTILLFIQYLLSCN